jgi:hypothetical protein
VATILKGENMMSYSFKTLVVLVSLLVMAGCGLHLYAPMDHIAEYPSRHAEFDYHYFWKTDATDKGLVVEGFLKNVRYAYIDRVDLTLTVLDKSGHVIAKTSDFPMPQQSAAGDLCNFSLLFKNFKLTPGNIFLFQVRYTSDDGDHGGSSWDSSFKVDALTGTVIRQ